MFWGICSKIRKSGWSLLAINLLSRKSLLLLKLQRSRGCHAALGLLLFADSVSLYEGCTSVENCFVCGPCITWTLISRLSETCVFLWNDSHSVQVDVFPSTWLHSFHQASNRRLHLIFIRLKINFSISREIILVPQNQWIARIFV